MPQSGALYRQKTVKSKVRNSTARATCGNSEAGDTNSQLKTLERVGGLASATEVSVKIPVYQRVEQNSKMSLEFKIMRRGFIFVPDRIGIRDNPRAD